MDSHFAPCRSYLGFKGPVQVVSKRQPKMDYARVDRMWWYPPFPPLTLTEEPCVVSLDATKAVEHEAHLSTFGLPEDLTSAGLHQELMQVVDVKGSYFMAFECLVCGKCKQKWISWSHMHSCITVGL